MTKSKITYNYKGKERTGNFGFDPVKVRSRNIKSLPFGLATKEYLLLL